MRRALPELYPVWSRIRVSVSSALLFIITLKGSDQGPSLLVTMHADQDRGRCFCANSFHADQGFPVDISQCNMPYVGNSSEMCGGARALLVYQSLPPPPPPPPGLVSNITYSAAGCYAEPPDGSRALDGFVIANANMTSEGCAYVCGLSNHLYYGLEYSDECWCGNNVSPNASIVSSATCNMPCKGNSSETCGGSLLLNLYNGTYHARDLPLPIDRFYNPEPRLLSFIQPVPVPEPFWCGNRSVETISG